MLTACAQAQNPGEDLGLDAGLEDGGRRDLGPQDLGAPDLGAPDLGPSDAGTCALYSQPGSSLPLTEADVHQLGDPDNVDTFSVAFEADCALTIVYEAANSDYTSGRLYGVRTTEFGTFSAAEVLPLGAEQIHGSPSRVQLNDDAYLYFVKTAGLGSPARLFRARFEGGAFEAPEALEDVQGISSLLSWPKFIADGQGGVALAYRDAQSFAFFRRSDDGLRFEAPVQISQAQIAIPTVESFEEGPLVYTFQIPGQTYVAYYALSSDRGETWTLPASITDASSNVHDATAVPRLDGDMDLYYIYPNGPHGFSIHRRALTRAGSLGPEELVTTPGLGNTQKPHLQRLSDGSLMLSYARVTRLHPQGYPDALALTVARIAEDAARP